MVTRKFVKQNLYNKSSIFYKNNTKLDISIYSYKKEIIPNQHMTDTQYI